MRNFHQESPNRSAPMLIVGICLALSLTGCIHPDPPLSSGGGSTPGGGTTCANLPSSATTYKGGDTLGEELTLSIDPGTLAYTITVDAGDQGRASTPVTGTLTQLTGCQYSSNEAGAVFTLGAGGVVQGGIKTVAGTSFAPLLAFSTTKNDVDVTSSKGPFGAFAVTLNAIGVQTTAGTTTSYGGSGRIRNAGTMQFCGGMFSANTCSTEKGYFVYNSTRGAFDYLVLPDPSAAFPNPPSGGTAAGSMIIGTVNGVDVALFLRRVSATDYGMLLLTPQVSLVSGTADGSYAVVDSNGVNSSATWSGGDFTRGTDMAMLTYDSPVDGVVAAAGTKLTGNLIYAAGIYGYVPSSAGGAAFELGLQE